MRHSQGSGVWVLDLGSRIQGLESRIYVPRLGFWIWAGGSGVYVLGLRSRIQRPLFVTQCTFFDVRVMSYMQ